ncbi:sulfatase [Echinicola pacifica]|uniref:Sulfatase n=1 Tax=Echinicola pacifica TaxID=346377 RepID=A0A918PVG1_9BACT|nr:sulfatase [Echinicola pacifica]GGZ24538.1 sulfatase [Echinicola pacifica]
MQNPFTPNQKYARLSLMVVMVLLIETFSYTLFAQQKNTADRPNIIWITSEDNSKHYLRLFDENGVATPNIERLAAQGVVFDHAFSNAPVCSVARSTLITGAYAPRIGAQYHRKIHTVPMPEGLEMFPAYLREAGYYTANNSKEDYNLNKSDKVWDESSGKASYKNREKGQPFFYVHNFGVSHEGQLHFDQAKMEATSLNSLPPAGELQPNHPQTPLFRYTRAYYLDRIQEMDRQIGELLDELEAEGLLENSIVFYFGDHGGVLPGSKGYLFETGLHVPLVVHIPKKYQSMSSWNPGQRTAEFVSFVDFAPTVLQLAGVSIPGQMDGRPFLNTGKAYEEDHSFGYADRFDEKYDLVRSLRKGKYKYIRNFMPFNFDGLYNQYRYKQLAYQEWLTMFTNGELTDIQAQFFAPKGAEMLYDVEQDPFETHNLAEDPAYQKELKALRGMLNDWMLSMPDLSLYPEFYLIQEAFTAPVAFGQAHQKEIASYLNTANLMLEDFGEVRQQISKALEDKDPWRRYWALVVATSFGKEAVDIAPRIQRSMIRDPERVNRLRAAQFLAIASGRNPAENFQSELYATSDPTEALLILNMLVQLLDGGYVMDCPIDLDNMVQQVLSVSDVADRISYINSK